MKLSVDAYDIGSRFVGLKEVAGTAASPLILAMLRLDADWPIDDATPWCSAWLNWVCWLLRLPRSKSLAARSWLSVGRPIALADAAVGFDVVILSRPPNATAGHVGLYAGHTASTVSLLAGNQGDAVSVAAFDQARILGVRRLA